MGKLVTDRPPARRKRRQGLTRVLILLAVFFPAANSLASNEADEELIAYGEYLASECVTCHQITGQDNGIPPIIGWDRHLFMDTLKLYRSGTRKNPVMRMIATPLSDAEIEALAAYFGSLKPQKPADGSVDFGPKSRLAK